MARVAGRTASGRGLRKRKSSQGTAKNESANEKIETATPTAAAKKKLVKREPGLIPDTNKKDEASTGTGIDDSPPPLAAETEDRAAEAVVTASGEASKDEESSDTVVLKVANRAYRE